METVQYYRIVLDLYKEILTDKATINQVNTDRILEVQQQLANAVTEAKVLGMPSDHLDSLLADLEHLKYQIL